MHCDKTADQIWMLFGMVSQMGMGMRQVVGFGGRSMGGGNIGDECGAPANFPSVDGDFAV